MINERRPQVKRNSSPEESLDGVRVPDVPKERPPIPRRVPACHGEHRGEAMCGREAAVRQEPVGERDMDEDHPLSRTDIHQPSKEMIFRALEIIQINIQGVSTKKEEPAQGPSKRPASLQEECSRGRNVQWIVAAKRREIVRWDP